MTEDRETVSLALKLNKRHAEIKELQDEQAKTRASIQSTIDNAAYNETLLTQSLTPRLAASKSDLTKRCETLRNLIRTKIDEQQKFSFFVHRQRAKDLHLQALERYSSLLRDLSELQHYRGELVGMHDEAVTLQGLVESVQKATEELKQETTLIRDAVRTTHSLQHEERIAFDTKRQKLEAELTKLQIENLGDYRHSLECEYNQLCGLPAVE